jgi:hypothetical protein
VFNILKLMRMLPLQEGVLVSIWSSRSCIPSKRRTYKEIQNGSQESILPPKKGTFGIQKKLNILNNVHIYILCSHKVPGKTGYFSDPCKRYWYSKYFFYITMLYFIFLGHGTYLFLHKTLQTSKTNV